MGIANVGIDVFFQEETNRILHNNWEEKKQRFDINKKCTETDIKVGIYMYVCFSLNNGHV